MKKILLLLFSFFSFIYANYTNYDVVEYTYYPVPTNSTLYNCSGGAYNNPRAETTASAPSELWGIRNGTSLYHFYDKYYSNTKKTYYYARVTTCSFTVPDEPVCVDGYVFDSSSNLCVPPPVCDDNKIQYSGSCYDINSIDDDVCPGGFIVPTSKVDASGNTMGTCSSCRDISSDVTAQTPDGWISFVNTYNTEQECAKKANEYIGRYKFQIYQKDSCTYNICYVDTFNYNGCEDAQNYSDLIEPGYIMKGIVNLEESCRSYVDTVNYLNYYVKRVYPDCEFDKSMYCFLKPSLGNPDNGIPPPDSNNTNPNGTIKLDSNNSSVPELNASSNNQYDLNTTKQTNNLLTSLSMDMKRFINKYNEDDEYWRKENDKKFKERTENDNANAKKMLLKLSSVSGTLSSKLSSLNVDITSKLDTLNDTIEDKNLSVDIDLNTTNEKLNDIKKEINATNKLLSGVLGESNYSTPEINNSAGSLSQYLPSDSWFDDNKIDLSISYDGDCYLQTFTWTDSTGTHIFPPVEFVDDLPLEKISKLLMALLFVIGLKDFLKD